MEFEKCPNCGAKVTGGFFGNSIVTHATPYINESLQTDVPAHCTKCVIQAESLANSTRNAQHRTKEERRKSLLAEADTMMPDLPLASIHQPPTWKFDVLGLVTAQSVAGTGLFADVGSTLTDMFGLQSGTFRDKIQGGENLCQRELRLKALQLGANAITGVDVDYAEVGGARCMLMVCMTGTAVKISNLDVLEPRAARSLTRLTEIMEELRSLA